MRVRDDPRRIVDQLVAGVAGASRAAERVAHQQTRLLWLRGRIREQPPRGRAERVLGRLACHGLTDVAEQLLSQLGEPGDEALFAIAGAIRTYHPPEHTVDHYTARCTS